ncbi:hypothetical protein ILUMI_03695 [Ignelater luminosus]|uniref:Uncharacterized protein n=1 Tax=Ignelater luminosus TaxID=2038154 RepID=A0A8K0GK82_IGNLU|nr:hypothetical protein ILUMI_03695 [Ignelater luminosus]
MQPLMLLEMECPKRKQQQRSRYLELLFNSKWEITQKITIGPPSVLTADEKNTLPKTPERKGKRNSERMPFAISSKKWKVLFQEKASKEAKLQQDKELRKKERESLNANKRKLKEIK